MTDMDPASAPKPPMPADTRALGAIGEMFQDSGDERQVPRREVRSWAMWDWATQPFNSVILTFVFVSLYLVSDHFLPADIAALADKDPVKERALADLSSGYGLISTLAGVLILLVAPVLGQLADRAGRKKRWLLVTTALLALIQFSLFFVFADPIYFWYGAVMVSIAAGNTSPVVLCRLLSSPTPMGLVRVMGRPGRAASLRMRRSGSAVPVTAMPYVGSGESIECPPITGQPASAATSRPPCSTSDIWLMGSSSRGQPTRLIATTGVPPIA